ncbi:hypothetical protein ABZP36_030808 [Zizania latifolia]
MYDFFQKAYAIFDHHPRKTSLASSGPATPFNLDTFSTGTGGGGGSDVVSYRIACRYAFQTPESWTADGGYRALHYVRPLGTGAGGRRRGAGEIRRGGEHAEAARGAASQGIHTTQEYHWMENTQPRLGDS